MIPPPLVGRLLARSRRTSARHCAIKLLFNRENISVRAALSPVCVLPFALPSDRRHSQDDGLAERVASHVSSFLRQRNSDTEELRLDAPGPWIFSIDPFCCGPIHTRASYRRFDPPSIDFPETFSFRLSSFADLCTNLKVVCVSMLSPSAGKSRRTAM
jgi:hypothetical protein